MTVSSYQPRHTEAANATHSDPFKRTLSLLSILRDCGKHAADGVLDTRKKCSILSSSSA